MEFRRLFEILPFQQKHWRQDVALAHRAGDSWETFSTEECIRIIDRLSAGFLKLGLKKGEAVGIMANSGSPYWNFIDLALLKAGAVVVPIHAVSTVEEIAFILNDAQINYCFVSDRTLYEHFLVAKPEAKQLRKVYTLEQYPDLPYWRDLLVEPTGKHLEIFQAYKAGIHEDDLATIVYTSGATGQPKGVELSHKNIISNIKSIVALVPVNCDKRVVSMLPLSHIFERMVVYTYMAVGASVYYLENSDRLLESLRRVRPHYFTAVPRLLERTYKTFLARGRSGNPLRRAVFRWAVKLGKRYQERRPMSPFYYLKLVLADWMVFRQWRRAFGGKVDGIFVGAAALKPELGRLFSAAGLEVREGYGLTETAPVITFNRFEPSGCRFGTVGIPIPGVEVKIDASQEEEEGEILIKGPNVMLGYHNQPELTSSVFTEDGWLRTGDIGKFVNGRFLKVTGRQSDLFKTSSGKFVSPRLIEARLEESPYIHHSMVIGLNRPFVSALIVPEFERLRRWCQKHNIHWTSPPYMVINHKVIRFLEEEVERLTAELPNFEKIRTVELVADDWTVESGIYTPTLKLKRPVVRERYKKEIEGMYQKEVI